jgi:hypothetical protein
VKEHQEQREEESEEEDMIKKEKAGSYWSPCVDDI